MSVPTAIASLAMTTGRSVGKATGSRERAPDDRLRVPTIQDSGPGIDGGNHFAFTILRQCRHAAPSSFALAPGVRNAECADSVPFGSLGRGCVTGNGFLVKPATPACLI